MSLNNHNIVSIKIDDEIDPRFYHLPNPENDNIENFHEFFEDMEEVSENINSIAIGNIRQNGQNEIHNEIQNNLNKTQNETLNELNLQNEQNGTYNEHEQNWAENELILNSIHEEIEDELKQEKEKVQIPHEVKNKIGNMILPDDIFILKKNLVAKKLDDSLKTKSKDKLVNLYNNNKDINSLTFKYEDKKISKKEGSSMEFLKRKRNPK